MPANWGIDLGNSFIKMAKMSGNKLSHLSAFSNPLGKLAINTEVEMTTLSSEIKKRVAESKVDSKKFRLVIPDSFVYFRVISLPVLSDAELASAIRWEAEQYVPMKLEDVELSWDVIDRPKERVEGEKMQVLLVAAAKENVAKMVELLGRVDIEVEAVEPELIAASRSLLYGRNYQDGTMLCLLGADGMSLSMFVGEKLVFVYRFASGGMALTRAISASLQLTPTQAEEYKRAYGVMENVLEGKLYAAMSPVIDGIISEIKKAQSFFAQNNPGVKLSRIIVSGGVAMMPGWVQLLTNRLGVEVSIGDPFNGLQLANEKLKTNPSLYASVIGTLKD